MGGGGGASGMVTDDSETFKYLCIWVPNSHTDTANYYANCNLYILSYCTHRRRIVYYGIWFVGIKFKCAFVQALRLCTGRTAYKGSRGIAILFHDRGTRRELGVSVRPW